jgi:hypothetical protein
MIFELQMIPFAACVPQPAVRESQGFRHSLGTTHTVIVFITIGFHTSFMPNA